MIEKQNKLINVFIRILEILKILVIEINILVLIFTVIVLVFTNDTTPSSLFAMILLILSNMYFIVIHGRISKIDRKKSWIGLIIKRKTLEEKKKIADIENQLKLNN